MVDVDPPGIDAERGELGGEVLTDGSSRARSRSAVRLPPTERYRLAPHHRDGSQNQSYGTPSGQAASGCLIGRGVCRRGKSLGSNGDRSIPSLQLLSSSLLCVSAAMPGLPHAHQPRRAERRRSRLLRSPPESTVRRCWRSRIGRARLYTGSPATLDICPAWNDQSLAKVVAALRELGAGRRPTSRASPLLARSLSSDA
jgi:hypothetical protein